MARETITTDTHEVLIRTGNDSDRENWQRSTVCTLSTAEPDIDHRTDIDAYHKAKVEIMRAVALAGLKDAGLDVTADDLEFSLHAGCEVCPCSPGFYIGTDYGREFIVEPVKVAAR